MQIGDRIAKRRKELGLTQDELAARTGYKSKAAISKIETNVNDITQSAVVKFAEALDTSVAYLMGWEEKTSVLDLNYFSKKTSEEEKKINETHKQLLTMFDSLDPASQQFVLAQLRGAVLAQQAKDNEPEEN